MTVDTAKLRRWSNAVAGWFESGMTITTMEVAGKLAPLSIDAADEIDKLRAALAAVPHSTFCTFMTAAYAEPCCCPKSLNTEPTDPSREQISSAVGGVLFNVSNFPRPAQPRLLGQDMSSLREKLTDAVSGLLAGRRGA